MDATLLERAQNAAELGNGNKLTAENLLEIGEVYYLLFGKKVDCVFCNVYTLLGEIRSKVIKQPKDFNPMAKYQFKANARGIKVIRRTEEGVTKVITSENLNKSDNAKYMQEKYPHLIEESKHKAEAEESAAEQDQGRSVIAPAEGEAKPAAKKSK